MFAIHDADCGEYLVLVVVTLERSMISMQKRMLVNMMFLEYQCDELLAFEPYVCHVDFTRVFPDLVTIYAEMGPFCS